jgi:cytochrome oxidase Cu insertion factor (SCO1/SenC/PrrC family)
VGRGQVTRDLVLGLLRYPEVPPLSAAEQHPARLVDVLGVSVDPRGDTAAGARAWAAERGLGRPFHYLLGSGAALAPVWRDWFVVGPGGALDDPRTHAAAVWLVDGAGRLRGRWSGGRAIAPADIAHDLRVLLDES